VTARGRLAARRPARGRNFGNFLYFRVFTPWHFCGVRYTWTMLETLDIPDDLETCQRLLRELAEAHARLQRVYEELLDTCASVQDSQQKLQQERDELQLTIQRLLHQLYGRRSERRKEGRGQQHLDFGDADTTVVDLSIVSAASDEEVISEYVVRRRQRRPRPHSEQLPEHLERRTMRLEPVLPAGVKVEDCELIGVDVVEVLEFDRAKVWVRRIEYPKYKLPAPVDPASASAACEAPVGQDASAGQEVGAVAEASGEHALASGAEMPEKPGVPAAQVLSVEHGMSGQGESSGEQLASAIPAASTQPAAPLPVVPPHGILQAPREVTLIPGGRFGFGVATEVLFSKFVLHVPLYRQQDAWAQSGWSPSRSTLGQIVTVSAELFLPLADLLRQRILATSVLGTDDTPVTLLTPGVGEGSRQARFWLYRSRDVAPYNVFAFTDSRARAGPDAFLESFTGTITGDCYSGYVNIEKVTHGRIRFSACLSHARRKIFEARQQQPGLSSQILALMGELYDVEDRARTLARCRAVGAAAERERAGDGTAEAGARQRSGEQGVAQEPVRRGVGLLAEPLGSVWVVLEGRPPADRQQRRGAGPPPRGARAEELAIPGQRGCREPDGDDPHGHQQRAPP